MKPNLSLSDPTETSFLSRVFQPSCHFISSPHVWCLHLAAKKSSIDLAAVNLCEFQLRKIRSGHIQRWQQQGLGEKASWSKTPAKMGWRLLGFQEIHPNLNPEDPEAAEKLEDVEIFWSYSYIDINSIWWLYYINLYIYYIYNTAVHCSILCNTNADPFVYLAILAPVSSTHGLHHCQ